MIARAQRCRRRRAFDEKYGSAAASYNPLHRRHSTPMTFSADTARGAFFVVAREAGAEHPALPTWANRQPNPAALAQDHAIAVVREEVERVPGAFQLLNVLTAAECERLIALGEALGYLPDAAVSLPRAIRHNDNVTWVADTRTTDILWQRTKGLFGDIIPGVSSPPALGVNARFRFYRYAQGDFFKPHTDGAWPGSAVIDDELITNAYPDRYSQLSFIVFLNDDYDGERHASLCPPMIRRGQRMDSAVRAPKTCGRQPAACCVSHMVRIRCTACTRRNPSRAAPSTLFVATCYSRFSVGEKT